MRAPILVLVATILLFAVALAVLLPRDGESPAVPTAPSDTPGAGLPPPEPATPAAPEPGATTPGTDAPADEPPPAEPAGWADLERSLTRETDPAEARTRKALETMSVYVDFTGAALTEVARFLTEQTRIDVQVLPVTFEERARPELLVSLPQGAATVTEVLDAIAAAVHLTWWIEGEGVRIAPLRPRPEPERLSIPLGALSRPDGGYEPDAVADIIRERIDLQVWEENGEIEIDHDGNALVVTAPAETQRRILALLRELLAQKR